MRVENSGVVLTLTLGERPQVAAPVPRTFLLSDEPHLCLLLAIHGNSEEDLVRLQPLVNSTGEAPANHCPHIARSLEGEAGRGEREADQPHTNIDLGRSRQSDQAWVEKERS